MNLYDMDAIIFDFDGVLVESVDVKTSAFASLYEKYGDEVVARVVDYHLRHGGISRFDKFRYFQTEILHAPPLDDEALANLAESFSSLVVDRVVSAPMVTGAQDFLDDYRNRSTLFIVSGTPTAELEEILRRRQLREYFTAIYGSPASKGRNISELLHAHEISASHAVMFGDAFADYEGAVSNSVNFLGRVGKNTENPFPSNVTTFVDFSHLSTTWGES